MKYQDIKKIKTEKNNEKDYFKWKIILIDNLDWVFDATLFHDKLFKTPGGGEDLEFSTTVDLVGDGTLVVGEGIDEFFG